jgi:hypothetical protein
LDLFDSHARLADIGIAVDDHLRIANRDRDFLVAGNCYYDAHPFQIPLAIAKQLVKAFCDAMTVIIPVDTADTESTLLAVVLAPSSVVRQLVLDVVAAV